MIKSRLTMTVPSVLAVAALSVVLTPVTVHAKPVAARHTTAGVIFDFENGIQGWSGGKGTLFSQDTKGATTGSHSLKIANYNGAFAWIGSDKAGKDTAAKLHNAPSLYFDITFPSDVALKKDKNGHQWFTFILATIGANGKWNQGQGMASVPAKNGVVKAGTYPLAIAMTGENRSFISGPSMRISIGPGTSGLAHPIAFYIDSVRTTPRP